MAKAINSVECFEKIHSDALKQYLGEDKYKDAFQVMLRSEMYFWKRSNCGEDQRMMDYHNMLVRRRKQAIREKESR